jgi:hypothetical protein
MPSSRVCGGPASCSASVEGPHEERRHLTTRHGSSVTYDGVYPKRHEPVPGLIVVLSGKHIGLLFRWSTIGWMPYGRLVVCTVTFDGPIGNVAPSRGGYGGC